jgi:hypothetical protein
MALSAEMIAKRKKQTIRNAMTTIPTQTLIQRAAVENGLPAPPKVTF